MPIGATNIQPVNFLDQYAKGLELGVAERALERQEVDRIKAANQQAALNEMYRAAMGPSGRVDTNALYGMLARQDMGGLIPGMQQAQADIAFKEGQASKQRADAQAAAFTRMRDVLATVNDQAGYDVWRQSALREYGNIPGVETLIPAKFSPEVKSQLILTANDVVSRMPMSPEAEAQKVRIAGAGAARTNVQAFTPASETAQVEFIKEFRATYNQLKTAPTDVANLRRAAELSKTEARKYMGTGGQAFLSAAKFLKNRLGIDVNTKAIVDAEEARTTLFQNVLNNLRKLDAQPSQQQQFIMQEALGNLDTDPDALPRVVQVYEDVIRGRVEQHNREFAEMKANPNLANAFPYSLEIKLPERVAAAPPPSGAPATDPAALAKAELAKRLREKK